MSKSGCKVTVTVNDDVVHERTYPPLDSPPDWVTWPGRDDVTVVPPGCHLLINDSPTEAAVMVSADHYETLRDKARRLDAITTALGQGPGALPLGGKGSDDALG